MYRDLFIRFYLPELIKKVDLLRKKGIDITKLFEEFISNYKIGEENA